MCVNWCLSFILSLGYKKSLPFNQVTTEQVKLYNFIFRLMLDSVFETFICFMTSQNCLKCQGQAIKIIVKITTINKNLMLMCSRFHFQHTTIKTKYGLFFSLYISSSIDYDCSTDYFNHSSDMFICE